MKLYMGPDTVPTACAAFGISNVEATQACSSHIAAVVADLTRIPSHSVFVKSVMVVSSSSLTCLCRCPIHPPRLSARGGVWVCQRRLGQPAWPACQREADAHEAALGVASFAALARPSRRMLAAGRAAMAVWCRAP